MLDGDRSVESAVLLDYGWVLMFYVSGCTGSEVEAGDVAR